MAKVVEIYYEEEKNILHQIVNITFADGMVL